ncbi:MAG: hypothetical protein NC124_04605 [Clostridium sp.]|nr:hypothetical protein [Clostridium sp.]
MSAFWKLTRESRKFYLAALGLMLFFVISDTVYICRDSGIAFTGSSIEQKIGQEIKQIEDSGGKAEISNHIKNLTIVFEDKANNVQLIGFITTIIGVILLLIIRKFHYTDVRTREFYRMLPVKESAVVLYDYIAVLLLIVIGALVQGGVLLAALTNYNRTLAALIGAGSASAKEMIDTANEYTLIYLLCYLLFIVTAYTWIYLGVTVTKNPIAGTFVSVAVWYILYTSQNWYGVYDIYCLDRGIALEESNWDNIISFSEACLSPTDFFDYLNVGSRTMTAYGGRVGYSMWINIGALLVFLLLSAICIFAAAAKRELTKGKLFYFPLLDFPFSVLCGIGICMTFAEWGAFALVAGFVSAFCLSLLIHPFYKQKSVNWEVK